MLPVSPSAINAFLQSLLVADWENAAGPVRFGSDLRADELKSAFFFQNLRSLLLGLDESGGTAATATGNLNRAFVEQLFGKLILSKPFRESIVRYTKVLNERDLWPLHLVRIVAQCAGLVTLRSKRFRLTRCGRELLLETQAGALYRRVFLAYLRKFDLHYDFHLRDVPGIQQTMGVVLWRLALLAEDWVRVRGLAPQVLLPGVLDQLHAAMRSEFDTEEWILAGYVLDPLHDLGLIERLSDSEWPAVTDKDSIRITALWRKFIRFDFESGQVGNARN